MLGSLEDIFGWVMDKVGFTKEFTYDNDKIKNHSIGTED